MVEKTIALPTREECRALWDHYKTPKHIRRHMEQVNRVAVYLAQRLRRAGKSVNIDLVDRASLLHDTLRVTEWKTLTFEYFPEAPTAEEIQAWEAQRRSIPSHIPHAQVNADLFRDRFPELANVIAVHSISDAAHLHSWEEKIVHYADRRVSHDRIVTLHERLDEAHQRYARVSGESLERRPDIVAALHRLQDELFSMISEDPDQLAHNLESHEPTTTLKTSSPGADETGRHT